MKIVLTDDNGTKHDVTEAVQIVYDALTASMDYGSGFLDYEEIAAIKALAVAGGWEQPEYPVTYCESCHHDISEHRVWEAGTAPEFKRRTISVPCFHRMRIYPQDRTKEPPTRCGCEDVYT